MPTQGKIDQYIMNLIQERRGKFAACKIAMDLGASESARLTVALAIYKDYDTDYWNKPNLTLHAQQLSLSVRSIGVLIDEILTKGSQGEGSKIAIVTALCELSKRPRVISRIIAWCVQYGMYKEARAVAQFRKNRKLTSNEAHQFLSLTIKQGYIANSFEIVSMRSRKPYLTRRESDTLFQKNLTRWGLDEHLKKFNNLSQKVIEAGLANHLKGFHDDSSEESLRFARQLGALRKKPGLTKREIQIFLHNANPGSVETCGVKPFTKTIEKWVRYHVAKGNVAQAIASAKMRRVPGLRRKEVGGLIKSFVSKYYLIHLATLKKALSLRAHKKLTSSEAKVLLERIALSRTEKQDQVRSDIEDLRVLKVPPSVVHELVVKYLNLEKSTVALDIATAGASEETLSLIATHFLRKGDLPSAIQATRQRGVPVVFKEEEIDQAIKGLFWSTIPEARQIATDRLRSNQTLRERLLGELLEKADFSKAFDVAELGASEEVCEKIIRGLRKKCSFWSLCDGIRRLTCSEKFLERYIRSSMYHLDLKSTKMLVAVRKEPGLRPEEIELLIRSYATRGRMSEELVELANMRATPGLTDADFDLLIAGLKHG